MRKIFILIMAFNFLYSCEEDYDVNKELNITLKSTQESIAGITPLNGIRINIYPNPFQNYLAIECSGATSFEIYIYNYEGSEKKFVIEDTNIIQLDFSNEKDGAYIIEMLVDGFVYREFVIKES